LVNESTILKIISHLRRAFNYAQQVA